MDGYGSLGDGPSWGEASCVLDSLGTKEEHTLMEDERERHSCAVVVIQRLETCNMQGGNTEKQDVPPLPAALGTALSPLSVCGLGKTTAMAVHGDATNLLHSSPSVHRGNITSTLLPRHFGGCSC